MPGIVFTEKDRVNEFRDWSTGEHGFYEDVIEAMFRRGVMPDVDSREPFFTCAAHTDKDADFTIGVFEEAVKEVNSKR
jgi:glutamate-1-semialdehyde aminotransferase